VNTINIPTKLTAVDAVIMWCSTTCNGSAMDICAFYTSKGGAVGSYNSSYGYWQMYAITKSLSNGVLTLTSEKTSGIFAPIYSTSSKWNYILMKKK